MSSIGCSFCQHANPAGAKFCNECGAVLRLQPCPHCDAINDRDAARCHHCDATLSGTVLREAATVGFDPMPGTPAGETESSVARALATIEADLANLSDKRAAAAHDTLSAVRLHPFWRAPGISLRRAVGGAALLALAVGVTVVGYQRTMSRPASEILASQPIETRVSHPVSGSVAAEAPAPALTGTAEPDGAPVAPAASTTMQPAEANESREPKVAAVEDEKIPAQVTGGGLPDRSSSVTEQPVAAVADTVAAVPSRSVPRAGKTRARKQGGGGAYEVVRARVPAPGADVEPHRIGAGDCTTSVAALGLCTGPDDSNGR